jgi:hypothetical protein
MVMSADQHGPTKAIPASAQRLNVVAVQGTGTLGPEEFPYRADSVT